MAFSKSGFWLDWKRDGIDPAASLLQAYTRILSEARPLYFILENVYALTFDNKASRPAFTRLLKEIEFCWIPVQLEGSQRCGLRRPASPTPSLHRGCSQAGETPRASGSNSSWAVGAPEIRGWSTSSYNHGQALAGLVTEPEREEVVRGRWGHLLPEIPPGGNYLHFTEKLGHPDPIFEWRSRYWSFLLKLDPDRPAPTIQAQPGPNVGPFHWEGRRLRIPELRRLFTFPDEYAFVGKRISVQSQYWQLRATAPRSTRC